MQFVKSMSNFYYHIEVDVLNKWAPICLDRLRHFGNDLSIFVGGQMIRIFACISVFVIGVVYPFVVHADNVSYTNFSVNAESWVETDDQSINVSICFQGIKVGNRNLYNNCARLKATSSRRSKDFGKQYFYLVFETKNTQLVFKSNSTGGNGNNKFWLRENSTDDTRPGFNSWIKKFDKPRQAMVGAMCSKFADDLWLKQNVSKALKGNNVSQAVYNKITWDRAFKAWDKIATRCHRLAARQLATAVTMQPVPQPKKFAACGLNWQGNIFSLGIRKAIQSGLKKRKILEGSIDGQFGPKTCKAVKLFLDVEGRNPKNTFDSVELRRVQQTPTKSVLQKYQINQTSCNNYRDRTSISRLQDSLKRARLYRGKVDGIAGSGTREAVEKAEQLLGYQVTSANGCLDTSEFSWLSVIATARDAGIFSCDLSLTKNTYDTYMPILKDLGYATYWSKSFNQYTQRNFVKGVIKFEADKKSISPTLIQKNCTLSGSEKGELIRLSTSKNCEMLLTKTRVKRVQQALKQAGLYDFVISGNLNSPTLVAIEKAEARLMHKSDMKKGCLSEHEISWLRVLSEARNLGIPFCSTGFNRTEYNQYGKILKDLGYFPFFMESPTTSAQQNYIRAIMQFETDKKYVGQQVIQPNCALSSTETKKLNALAAEKDCPILANRGSVANLQNVLAKAGLYGGSVSANLSQSTLDGIKRAKNKLSRRASSNGNCISTNELGWLKVLGEARGFGIYQCDLDLDRKTFSDYGPKLKDLGYLKYFQDNFAVRNQQDFVKGVIRFEGDEYSSGSKQIKRDCSLSPSEEIELERLWQIKTKAPIDTTPDATKLSETYTLQMAQNLISDLETYLQNKEINPFGIKLVSAYAKASDVAKQGAWSDEDKKNFKSLKDLVLSNTEFALYHSAQVSERTTKKSRILKRLGAVIDNLIADGTLFMQTNPLVDSASQVAEVTKEIRKVRDQSEVSTLLKAIQKIEQQYETLGVPFRKIEFITDDLLLTDEQKALVEQIRSAQERRQTAALLTAAQEAENERNKQEAKLKEKELENARVLAETKEREDKVNRYKLEAATLLQDIREYVRAGNQFDISLPKYLQDAKGAEKADEWSAELLSGYEQLLSYVNKFDQFRQFRSDKEKQRELQKQKLLADLRADRVRILKELEEWIKANPFSEAAATLVSLIDEYAKEEENDDIDIMEKRLALLIEKVRASGVELPISELFERRGYSLDGANEPLAPANVITTLSDAQQYIKDVQNFVKENPTVFGPELVKLYNGIRSVVDQDEWNDDTKSAFSSFETFTGKQSLFTAFRKSEINKRAEGRKLALERLRKALLQLLADGSVYIQNNQFAENALTIYQAVEFGRSLERNTDPSDILKAVDKIKKVYNDNGIPFTDTLIEIEFLEMSVEEIRIVNEMNEAYRRRTADLQAKKVEIETLNKKIVEDKIATELANAKSEAENVSREKEITENAAEIIDVKRKNFEEHAAEMRLEAKDLVADAREFVEQGNRFGLEFILLNAGIVGFEVETWQQPLFDNYIKFRNYVLENEEFVSFRKTQIENRKIAATEAFDYWVNELGLMQKSLEGWVLKNQIDPKAAAAFGIYQELAMINIDQPKTIGDGDVLRLKTDVKAIAEKLAKLSIPGVYIYEENPTTTIGPITDPDSTPEDITLESAQNTLADVKNYIQTGQGTFDSKKFPILFANIRDIEKGVWNPKMEQAALEFRQFVLSSDQFSEYHSQQIKIRAEKIIVQKEEIVSEIENLRKGLDEWLASNPFDERAVSVVTELENLESELGESNGDELSLPLARLSSILKRLKEFAAGLKLPDTRLEGTVPIPPGPLPSTKVIFVNLSGSAAHAIRNLDGEIVFDSEQADYCYAMINPLQKVDRFYLRKLIGQKTKAPQFEALSPCSVANISTMDLIITDGRAINEGNLAVKSATEMGYEQFAEVEQVEIEAEAERDLILVENLKNDLEQGVRAGFGYVVNNNSSSVGCLTIDGSEDAHSILISQAEDRINLYRDTRVSVFEFMSIDQAFSQWQRGRCGVVYANADDLSRFIESLENNQDDFDLSPDWYSAKKVDKIQNTIKTRDDETKRAIETRRRELELQKKLEEEARDKAVSEADKKQIELREIYGPRVKGLKEAFESEMNLALDQLLGKNTLAEPSGYLGKFRALDDVIAFHKRRDWEETERQMIVVDYGVAEWSDREVEANIIRAMVNVKNRTLGKYKEICFDLGYIWDQEFEMIRDPVAVSCTDGNIENWKNKQAFTSRWNVTLQ